MRQSKVALRTVSFVSFSQKGYNYRVKSPDRFPSRFVAERPLKPLVTVVPDRDGELSSPFLFSKIFSMV